MLVSNISLPQSDIEEKRKNIIVVWNKNLENYWMDSRNYFLIGILFYHLGQQKVFLFRFEVF